jgi:hypothetical protein
MPFPFAPFRELLLRTLTMLCSSRTRRLLMYFFQVAIGICNITSIVILSPVIVAHTAGRKCFQPSFSLHAHRFVLAFEVIAAASSIVALLVFPIT